MKLSSYCIHLQLMLESESLTKSILKQLKSLTPWNIAGPIPAQNNDSFFFYINYCYQKNKILWFYNPQSEIRKGKTKPLQLLDTQSRSAVNSLLLKYTSEAPRENHNMSVNSTSLLLQTVLMLWGSVTGELTYHVYKYNRSSLLEYSIIMYVCTVHSCKKLWVDRNDRHRLVQWK